MSLPTPAAASPALQAPFVLLDDARAGKTQLFEQPQRLILARTPAEVPAALAAMQGAHEAGLHLAGAFAYELGYLFEERLAPLYRAPPGPLIAFGAFAPPRAFCWPEAAPAPKLDLAPGWTLADYAPRCERIRAYIEAGDIYQANLTFPLTGRFAGEPLALYAALRARQQAAHGALVALTGEETLLSFSPELFFESAAGSIRARPMKGTAPRGRTPEEDARRAAALAASEKDRAENLMIVDLLRNDLGRVAQLGSVRVSDLFTIETYPTLFQMTSGIEARLEPGTGIAALLGALFPCGSVTGAPKIRAMEIIRDLEDTPRGAYCGAIGTLAPDGAARFNVAIRTAVLDAQGGLTLRVGSGVVHDSDPVAEYEECLLKARFLTG